MPAANEYRPEYWACPTCGLTLEDRIFSHTQATRCPRCGEQPLTEFEARLEVDERGRKE